MLNLIVLGLCVYIAYRVRQAHKRKVAPWCKYHSHEHTHSDTYWIQTDDHAVKTNSYSDAIQMVATHLFIEWQRERVATEDYRYFEACVRQSFFMWAECVKNKGGDITRDNVTVRITQ